MQEHMFLLGVSFHDFFVWTLVKNDYLLVRIERDEHFISEILPQLDEYFFAVLLPEVVSRKSDLSSDNKQKHYCICQRPCFESMIACNITNLAVKLSGTIMLVCQSLEHQKGRRYALNVRDIAEASL